MKCPMCGAELQDNPEFCKSCGCKIVYNGFQSVNHTEQNSPESDLKNSPKKSKAPVVAVIVAAVVVLCIIFKIIGNSNSSNSYDRAYGNYPTTSGYGGNDDVKDWMKDQAEGKEYNYNDGGEYYCMGKNDTCPNKTHNAYDLYCDSCDPDGDNIEG